MNKNTIFCVLVIFCSLFSFSCTSLHNTLYALFINEDNADKVIDNEKNVRAFLEDVLDMPDDYIITVYERTVLRSQKKRTELLTHSFYVVTNPLRGISHTVSFYGSKISFYSQGTWTIDANFDTASYMGYLAGNNKWDVVMRISENNINTIETTKKIISQIDEGVIYYYRSHLKKKPDKENCNTALYGTLVTNMPILLSSP